MSVHSEIENPVGNAAALREALESFMVGSCVYPCVCSGYDPIDELCMRCAASPQADGDCPYEKASKALSEPPRNCDEYDCKSDAEVGFVEQTGETDANPLYWQLFANWLFAPASERKGEGDEQK